MNPGMGMGPGGGGPRMMGPGPGIGMGGGSSMSGGMGGGIGPNGGIGMGPGMMSGRTESGPGYIGNNISDGVGSVSGSQVIEQGQGNMPQVSSPAPQPAQHQSKDVNTSTVCRIGQETVEEIVSRTQEVFSILKSLQPPVGSFNQQTQQHDKSNQEKQNRLQDVLKGIGMLFKRLRVCWEKCQENTTGMDFMPIESLIPLEDGEGRMDLEKKRGEAYKSALNEHNELVQQITLKNRHLKDVIDQMRNIIWEINTMLAIRKA